MGFFVVLEEGGVFHDLPLRGVLRLVRAGAPIFGLRVGGRRLIFDRILRGMGYSGWRISG